MTFEFDDVRSSHMEGKFERFSMLLMTIVGENYLLLDDFLNP